ncbi:DUF4426 domain-containing protein [Gallaecimonas xiamenensis]|uniref:DUF4426 domain-containing protein n=1 Tax=Gallaecimonas xiamenensis 3-C-1 TaxID=745411 RepID=K2JK90_9GAMM|nr:DUF4426 domain-containing protein [Gallaecimonas xiamenensis]EKE75703.1 hypothetical protein B3C1_06473 [Gallaecimonas xiamenensis 3-C-1]
MLMRNALTALLLTVLAMPALAEQMMKFGHYEVHYQALPTTFLTPQIASTYQIERSRFRGLVNIAVLDSAQGKLAVPASLSGQARNLLGNVIDLTFREVREGNAIYYIATLPYSNEEMFRFNVDITPQGGQPFTLKFEHKFYVD